MAAKSKTSKTAEPEAPAEQQPFRSYNRVQLAGRLVADPDLKYTPSGKAVCRFRSPTNATPEARFHDMVAWEPLAETAPEPPRRAGAARTGGRPRPRTCRPAD